MRRIGRQVAADDLGTPKPVDAFGIGIDLSGDMLFIPTPGHPQGAAMQAEGCMYRVFGLGCGSARIALRCPSPSQMNRYALGSPQNGDMMKTDNRRRDWAQ